MSLLDALLLDPVRINVWVACRTDGILGSGTQNDPYDGSSLLKFDEIMRKLSEDEEKTCVNVRINWKAEEQAFSIWLLSLFKANPQTKT